MLTKSVVNSTTTSHGTAGVGIYRQAVSDQTEAFRPLAGGELLEDNGDASLLEDNGDVELLEDNEDAALEAGIALSSSSLSCREQ